MNENVYQHKNPKQQCFYSSYMYIHISTGKCTCAHVCVHIYIYRYIIERPGVRCKKMYKKSISVLSSPLSIVCGFYRIQVFTVKRLKSNGSWLVCLSGEYRHINLLFVVPCERKEISMVYICIYVTHENHTHLMMVVFTYKKKVMRKDKYQWFDFFFRKASQQTLTGAILMIILDVWV